MMVQLRSLYTSKFNGGCVGRTQWGNLVLTNHMDVDSISGRRGLRVEKRNVLCNFKLCLPYLNAN